MFRLGAALAEFIDASRRGTSTAIVLDRGPPPRLRAARLAACTQRRLRSLQAEYYVDRGFVTKYLQTEPAEGRRSVLLGLDAARSLDDFAARPHELTRPYVDAAADEARREAARASRKRRKKDSWK